MAVDRARAGTAARCWRRSGRSGGRSTRTRRTRPGRRRCGPRPVAPSGAARLSPVGPVGRWPARRRSSSPAGPAPRPRRGPRRRRRSTRRRRRRNSAGIPRPIPERRLADIVAADDEVARLRQRQALEHRQLGDQPGAVRQPARHRREPERDRRADAPEAPTNQRPTR